MKLVDVVDVNQFPRAIITTAIDLTARTLQRITYENQIVELLRNHLKKFDSTLRMMPFGSATYGFGGSNTNFNLLVNAGKQKEFLFSSVRDLKKNNHDFYALFV